jgi:hypothetical protein
VAEPTSLCRCAGASFPGGGKSRSSSCRRRSTHERRVSSTRRCSGTHSSVTAASFRQADCQAGRQAALFYQCGGRRRAEFRRTVGPLEVARDRRAGGLVHDYRHGRQCAHAADSRPHAALVDKDFAAWLSGAAGAERGRDHPSTGQDSVSRCRLFYRYAGGTACGGPAAVSRTTGNA